MHLEPNPTVERLAYDDACARAARLWRKVDASSGTPDFGKYLEQAKEADALCDKLRAPLMRK